MSVELPPQSPGSDAANSFRFRALPDDELERLLVLVSDFLPNSAARFPDKVALVCDGQRLTYAQIERRANRMANGLLALGVQRGERIAVWMHNSVEAVIAIFAILKAGGTFTVVNPTTRLDKLAYHLSER